MTDTFEKNLENLEKLVGELESGDIPLQTAVQKYTEAKDLIDKCEKELKETKQKIQVLNENGNLEDFENKE